VLVVGKGKQKINIQEKKAVDEEKERTAFRLLSIRKQAACQLLYPDLRDEYFATTG
jgi:hypothetical protein